jgi:Neuraminidase (sialidase)
MSFDSQTIVGDYENGNLYAFDLDVYEDNGDTQKWLRSWRPIPENQNNLNRTSQHTLQLMCESGVGLNLYPAYEAQDLTTEDGLELIAEYVQKIVSTEAGVELTTESNDGFALIANQPDYPVPFIPPMILEANAHPAAVGYDPEAMLRWSDDGGHTWSNEHWTQMGRIGQYGYRAFWRRLGMTVKLRDRVYEVSGTDPVKIVITGANLLVSPTSR